MHPLSGDIDMKLFLVFVTTLFFSGISLADTKEDIFETKQQIKEYGNKIVNLEEEIQKDNESFRKYKINAKRRIESKKEELVLVSNAKDSLNALIKRYRRQLLALRQSNKEVALKSKAINSIILQKAKELRMLVKNGFPFKVQERLSAIDLLLRDINQMNVSQEEAFSRLWLICDSEERFGIDCDVTSIDMSLPSGQTMPVKMLRVGKQFLGYMSTNMDKYGLLSIRNVNGKLEYTWMHNNIGFEKRRAIKSAIEVKEGKKAPQLVVLPISIHLDGEVKK